MIQGGISMSNFNMAECVAWMSCALASIWGVYLTGNPWCLLALFIPAIVYTKSDKEKQNDRV